MIEKKNASFYIRRILIYVIITIIAVMMLFPFWYMFICMFRTNEQISSTAFHLLPEQGFGYLENIRILIERNFLDNVLNTHYRRNPVVRRQPVRTDF